jgi:hypothetical protein
MTHRSRRATARAVGSDQGSLPLAMHVTIVGMLLSAALVPVVVNQVTDTRVVAGRTHELQAAQAGIDVALGQLRAATDAAGEGDLEKLPPCTLTGTTGPSDPDPGRRWAYRVRITYFTYPDDATAPQPLACPPADVPVSATLSATGGRASAAPLDAGDAGTRTLEATYTFRTNNENITGGAIPVASPTVNPLCMDGGTDASPAAGSAVTMRRCKPTGSSYQRFAYTPDLNLKLVGSETAGTPAGMCLDAPYPRASGNTVRFQPCLGLQPRQQWSLNDSSNFRGSPNPGNAAETTYCLNLRNPGTDGSELMLGGCGGGDNVRIFRPRPEAGAGMASAAIGQLVNYKQFSRCLDVTNHVPTFSYMIVWFCKQDPNGNVSWNQKWTFPPQATTAAEAVPERIRSAYPTAPGYCLKSPGSTAANRYVTMSQCEATGPLTDESLKWTVFGDTGNYATSYRIVDAYGYCLTPTDLTVATPDTHTDGTAKVKVAPCTKSELQKWNAPANFNQPLVLTDTLEK